MRRLAATRRERLPERKPFNKMVFQMPKASGTESEGLAFTAQVRLLPNAIKYKDNRTGAYCSGTKMCVVELKGCQSGTKLRS